MFLDVSTNGPNGYWDEGPLCKGCKRLIDPSEHAEDLRFDMDDQRFEGMDGLYHAQCASPYLSLLRAMDMLRRMSR
jgi:hypothetical protein